MPIEAINAAGAGNRNLSAGVSAPTTFTVAYAPTVKQSSTNRSFTVKTLADLIAAEQPVPQERVDHLAQQHHDPKALNNAIKCLRPAIYPGQYPEGARVRTAQNIEGVTALTMDFDGRAGDRVTRAELLARCAELKIEVLIWDTFSSDDTGTTFRALFPLSKVLPSDCYDAAHTMLKDLLGMAPGHILPASQAYFITPRIGRKSNPAACFGRPVDQVMDFSNLEATPDYPSSGAGSTGKWDALDQADHAFDEAGRALFLRCLPAIEPWSEDRGHWIGVIGAGLRGWAITPEILKKLTLQTDEQKALLIELDSWSKNEHPPAGKQAKYTKGCVVREGLRLYSGTKMLGLRGVVEKARAAGWVDDEAAKLEAAPFEVAEQKATPLPVDWPPGLVGEVAHYIHGSSIMPVKSFAIAGALSLVSHLMMNRASIGAMETPTNLYQVMIGETGHGKEDPRSAIKRLLSATHNLDGLLEEATSDTALLRALNAYPVQLMMTDEFGIFLKMALSKQGDKHRQALIGLLLKLFGLARSVLSAKVFADTKLNIPAIHCPYINLLGTTTPVQFVGALTGVVIDDGTLNRMLCVSASGTSPKNRNPNRTVPDALRDRLRLFADLLNPTLPGSTILIDPDAEQVFVRFYNETPTGLYAALWSRHEEHARRVAGVIAAGDGGVIHGHHAEWAVSYVRWCLTNVSREVSQGMAESVFEALVLKALRFIRDARKYAGDREYGHLAKRGLMPRGKLSKLMRMKTRELDEVVNHLTESGEIGTAKEGQSAVYFPR